MKKAMILMVLCGLCAGAFGGVVGLPVERLALPEVQGNHLVCIWDQTSGTWLGGFQSYNHTGSYEFQVPEFGKWYWIGLWDESTGDYVFGKWIGHFLTD